MIFTRSEVEQYYASRFPELKLNGREARSGCPVHHGKDLNFVIDLESGLAMCHSQCGRGWDMIALEMELSGKDFGSAKDSIFEFLGRPKVPFEERNLEAVYPYHDANGKLVYEVLRYHGKEFKQRRIMADGTRYYSMEGVERVPFRLPQVLAAKHVALVEGEKDVLTLERMGIVATTVSGGSGQTFRPEIAALFRDKTVYIIPDNDAPGRKYAVKMAEVLKAAVKSVRIVELPDMPEKGDVTDYIQRGGTRDQLRKLCMAAPEWTTGWRFKTDVPHENDRYIRTFEQAIQQAGGLSEFWDLAKLQGLETPYTRLSRILGGGLRRGEVYVLGGNQGSGKSSLGLQFAIRAIRDSKPVLLFSMEMDHRAIFQRMAAIEARVNLNDLMDAQITLKRRDSSDLEKNEASQQAQEMSRKLWLASSELSGHTLYVSNKGGVTPEHVLSEAERLSVISRLELVIVDHLQLMDSNESSRSEYEKFTKISRIMKQVAVNINTPLLLISQTSRNQSFEKRGELEVSDLRGSGAFEEDAAAVMLLFEDAEDRKLSLAEGDRYVTGPLRTILKVGKNRYGVQGRKFQLNHFKTWTRFDEAVPIHGRSEPAGNNGSAGESVREYNREFSFGR